MSSPQKHTNTPATSTSTPTSTSISVPSATTTTTTTATATAANPAKQKTGYVQTARGIQFIDEGEKDASGNVILASKEPCEDCGGKVVWATVGEWFMVCQMCGEPQ
ncbi:hypothetical protein GMOD_00000555 [Pyrenophora seminiperda CCB06]|uniref:Uncharacterized protein n=1 Tax=Pyrenophora seminiperda CCB06 TaxID=1302712 RepID=A0A3M7M7V8_9PLEO|nr:hypothetical protein GMOD_00000555 [Pyrenophora seminiperda CCB06]